MKRLLVCLLTLVSFASLSACAAKPVPAELTILNEGETYGTITVEGEQIVGNTVTIKVTPTQEYYVLDEWYEVDDTERYPLDFRNPLNLKITEPKMTIIATWVPKYSKGLYFSPYPNETDPYFKWGVSQYQQIEGEKEITIPKIYHGRDVIRIGSGAFKNCDIETVHLLDNITSLGEDVFINTQMQSIKLPVTLENASNAFTSWKNDQIIYVPSACIIEESKTTWNWILVNEDGYYTSSHTGGAHIIVR